MTTPTPTKRRRRPEKAPFPAFGGKSRVAALAWARIGDVANAIEPFCNSAAWLLARPSEPKIETLNDVDAYISNFWRAIRRDPAAVAGWASAPVNEADLHAEHRWLTGAFPAPAAVPPEFADPALEAAYRRGWRDSYGPFDAASFRKRVRTDPDYCDARVAGLWVHGACCWIGSGWCAAGAEWSQTPKEASDLIGVHSEGINATSQQVPRLSAAGQGVNTDLPAKRPFLAGAANECGERTHQGLGLHAKGPDEKRPMLGGVQSGGTCYGMGVHAKGPTPWQQRPHISREGQGVHEAFPDDHRPQLADAYSRGRGVHADPPGTGPSRQVPNLADRAGGRGVHADLKSTGTCAARLAWLTDWFGRLADRLRTVRVCCGDWTRVCSSESVTTRLGLTGIFFDPPYGAEAGRDMGLYAHDSGTVAHEVRAYCRERGGDPMMRIALCGYAGEGHEELDALGWTCTAWKSSGGYGNRSEKGKTNAMKERIWFSPYCIDVDKINYPLFAGLEPPR